MCTYFSMEVVSRDDGGAAGELILGVFVETDGEVGAGNIVHIPEAVSSEDTAGVVAALAGAAVHVERAVLRELVQTVPELREGHVHRAADVAGGVFPGLAHVDDGGTALHEAAHGGDGDLPEFAVEEIEPHEARQMDGVLGGGEGRGVAEIDGGHVLEGAAPGHEGGNDVDAPVRSVRSHGLRAEDAPGGRFKVDFQMERGGSGHEAHPVKGNDVGKIMGNVECFDVPFVEAGGGSTKAEHLDAEAAEVAPVRAGTPADGVGGAARFHLGGEGEGEPAGGAFQRERHFGGVAHGVNSQIGGASLCIDGDGAACSDGEARGPGKGGAGPDADGHDDQISGHGPAGGEADGLFFDGGDAVIQNEMDAVVQHFFLEDLHHVMVEGHEDLGRRFHEGDVQRGREIGRRFRADESAADDRRGVHGMALQVLPDGSGIHGVLQGEYVGAAAAGNGREDGLRAGREDERVVRFFIDAAAGLTDAHFFLRPEDVGHFGIGAHVDAVLGAEAFRRHEDERRQVRNGVGQAVREGAAGVGNVGALFKEDDLGGLVEPAETGRGGRASCDAAHDEDLFRHGASPLSRGAPCPWQCGRRS